MCDKSCNCIRCRRLLTSSSIESTVITAPEINIYNGQEACLYLVQTVPVTSPPAPMVLVVGDNKFQLITRSGNYLYSDQILKGDIIRVEFATDSKLAVVKDSCLRRTSFVFTPLEVPATSTETKKK